MHRFRRGRCSSSSGVAPETIRNEVLGELPPSFMRSLVRREDDRTTPQGVRLIRDVRSLLLRDCGRHPSPGRASDASGASFIRSARFPSFAFSANLVATLWTGRPNPRANEPSEGRSARFLRPSPRDPTKAPAEVGKRARAQK